MVSINNPNAPAGLVPIKHGAGGTQRNQNYSDYNIAGSYGSNIFRGDSVAPTGTGNNVAVVAAGENPILGAFAGCSYVDSGGNTFFKRWWAASTAIQTGSVVEANVFDDPNQLYDIQVSGTTGPVSTNIGNTTNILKTVAGSQSTGTSGDQADGGDFSNSSTSQQLIVRALRALTNNTYAQYGRIVVQIFLHYNAAVAGQGTVY